MKNCKTTKDQLLMLLKKNDGITIEEIMEYFSISEPAIRKHLHEMERQGLVLKNAQKQKIGRPFFTYDLTEKGHGLFPNQYESLPVELLEDLEALQGPEAVKALLNKRMEREKQELQRELIEADKFEDKVQILVQLQNSSGYMVEIEREANGDYKLRNFNCPIANIAHKYTQVCSNEKQIYKSVFEDSEVIPKTYITAGDNVCTWIIKEPKEEE